MISTYKYDSITWIDLESPTEEELLQVISDYRIPDYLLNELLTETMLSKVDVYNDLIYSVLHFPRVHNEKRLPDLEVDFILSKNFLITIHYEFSNAIHDFARNFEVEVMLSKNFPTTHAGYIFHAIIMESYKQANHKLDDLYQLLESAKDQIFQGHQDSMVSELSHINRKILDFKQALRFHDGIFASLEKSSNKILGDDFTPFVESMRNEYRKIIAGLDGHREMLLDLRDTNDSLLSAKTNRTMRVLTIMSFTTFPLTLVATMLAMITHVNILRTPEQVFYVFSILILIGILIILHFRNRKWML